MVMAADILDHRLLVGLLDARDPACVEAVADRLGVGPEAVAEALEGLAREGVVERGPGGGFRAAPLDVDELRELYPATLMLECLAVRDAPPYDEATLDRLRAANDRLRAAASDPVAALAADDDFHATLVSSCENEPLLEVLGRVRRSLLRYERVYMIDAERVTRSADEHAAIVAALERGDHAAAAGGVRENYTGALPELAAQIERDSA